MSNTSLLGSYGGQDNSSLLFRNLLVNGACAIDQRNAGANQTITAAANIAYTVDRWYAYCTGANVVGARVASTGAYQFTGAASVTGINFGQRIEAANSAHLAGQTATLSVDLSNSLLTTVTWTAYYANSADTFGQAPASFTRTQIATGTFTVSSTVARYSASFAVPAAATTGIDIMFSVGAQTSGTWRINNAMLEAGPTATPFERRPYSVELSMAQRYYYRITSSTVFGPIAIGHCTSTSVANLLVNFPVTMRVPPVTIDNSAVSTLQLSDGNTAITCTAISGSGSQITTNTSYLGATVAAGLTIYRPIRLEGANNANAFIGFSAEL